MTFEKDQVYEHLRTGRCIKILDISLSMEKNCYCLDVFEVDPTTMQNICHNYVEVSYGNEPEWEEVELV